jgi:hypothetical protein
MERVGGSAAGQRLARVSAVVLAPLDRWLGSVVTTGAAFVAVVAIRGASPTSLRSCHSRATR